MKISRAVRAFCVVAAAAVLTPNAQATTYEGGNFGVKFLRVTQGKVMVSLDPAPVVCGGGTNWGEHLALWLNDPYGQELYSALLTAYVSGVRLDGIWFDEYTGPCSTPDNVPHLRQIRYAPK